MDPKKLLNKIVDPIPDSNVTDTSTTQNADRRIILPVGTLPGIQFIINSPGVSIGINLCTGTIGTVL